MVEDMFAANIELEFKSQHHIKLWGYDDLPIIPSLGKWKQKTARAS